MNTQPEETKIPPHMPLFYKRTIRNFLPDCWDKVTTITYHPDEKHYHISVHIPDLLNIGGAIEGLGVVELQKVHEAAQQDKLALLVLRIIAEMSQNMARESIQGYIRESLKW